MRAARVAGSRPTSSLAMRSLRLSTWRAKSAARCALGFERLFGRRPASSAVRRSAAFMRSCSRPSRSRSRERRSLSPTISLRTRTRSARSPASASACARMSGSTAPSVIAVRTACSASSGCTRSAGGGCCPTRCSAARISTIAVAAFVERFANERFLLVERLQPRPRRVDAGLDIAHARGGIDELLIERATILADRLDLAPQLRLAFAPTSRSWARTASSS